MTDTNLSLSISFKGQLKLKAQAVPLQEGYLKLGGFVASTETSGLAFGLVASAATSAPDVYTKGKASGNIVRGVVVFDDAIAQNAPAHPDKYLCAMPCAVLNHGFMWFAGWTKTAATGETVKAIDPVIGCKVGFNTTTGVLEFFAATEASAPSGWEFLTNYEVRSVDPENGALVYIN